MQAVELQCTKDLGWIYKNIRKIKKIKEGGSDLPGVSSIEFYRVSKNVSYICQKLSELLKEGFF